MNISATSSTTVSKPAARINPLPPPPKQVPPPPPANVPDRGSSVNIKA